MHDNLPVDEDLCSLEKGEGPVQRSEFNMLIRRVAAYHLRPMKQHLADTEKTLKDHIESCALNQAKVIGGIRVLTWLVSSGLGIFTLTWLAKFVGWLP